MKKSKNSIAKIFVSWFSVFGLRFLLVIVRILPEKLIYALGRSLSRLYYKLAHKNRKLALRNLRIALGKQLTKAQIIKIAKQSFNTMGLIILDTIRFKDLTKDRVRSLIKIEGVENLEQAFQKGKGVIAASAHLGSFTLIGARLAIDGYKAAFVARHARNKGIEKLIMSFCRQVGQKIVFNQPVVTCMRRCMKLLSRNELLVIEMDQNFGTEGQAVSFFNHPAMVATGPIKLAMSTQAAIVPIFIIHNKNQTRTIRIEPEIILQNTQDQNKDIKDNLQKIINIVEKYIRNYPGQWVNWIHKRWEVR
ncbi:MAG: hypothetical protein ABIG64_05545 [Candidatus Omnitrophota bacterium]